MEKLIIILNVLFVCTFGFVYNNYQNIEPIVYEKPNPEEYTNNYYLIHCGYIGNGSYQQNIELIISNKLELENFLNGITEYNKPIIHDTLQKYNDEFFNNKSLAIYYIELSSGSDSVNLLEPWIDGNTVCIKYSIDFPEIGTCDMSGELIVVEVDKNINHVLHQQIR